MVDSGISPRFWLVPLARLAGVAILGLVAGLIGGAALGWAVVSIGFGALVLVQLRYLEHLQRWLRAPRIDEIPDGWGAWSDVFAELYRAHRREQKSQAQLAAALDRFIQAAQAMPDGVILLDLTDRIEWLNASAERQFGISLARDRGHAVTNLVRYPDFSAQLQAGDASPPILLRIAAPVELVLSVQAIRFSANEKLVLARDVTILEQTETIRRDFIANVSHELRTPLTVVNGYLEHMTEGELADPKLARPIALMREQADRMTRLVEDLLTLSRLESVDNPPRDESVDVPALVASLVEEGRSLSKGRHTILAEVGAGRLRGAPEEIRAAFGNLLSNAIRYTPDGGQVTLRWQADAYGARFAVTDSGIGMAPEHVPRLTERFYRVDRSRSRETGGTGLGLAIVKHVLLRHDAVLEVQSEVGAGSTFTCVFPNARVVAAHQPASRVSRSP